MKHIMYSKKQCGIHTFNIRLLDEDAGVLLDDSFANADVTVPEPYYHYHTDWEILFAESEAVLVTRDGKVGLKGEFCFIPPMIRHRVEAADASPLSLRLELPDPRESRSMALLVSFLEKNELIPLKPQHEVTEQVGYLRKAFGDCLASSGSVWLSEAVSAAAALVICGIFAPFEASGELSRIPMNRRSFTKGMLLDHIMSHKEISDITVPQLAKMLGYSSEQTSRIIKCMFGKPLRKLMRDIIIERAADYLAHTELSAAKIAAMLGYSSPKSFSSSFHAVWGLSPTEYRRAVKASPFEMARISKDGTSDGKWSKI